MSKMKKCMIGIGIICIMIVIIAAIPKKNTEDNRGTFEPSKLVNATDDAQESGLVEDTGEQEDISEKNGDDTSITFDETESENGIYDTQEPEWESEKEKPHGVLYDVVVTAELTAEDTVNITLTNMSEFVVTKWSMAYESIYNIVSIENAEIISNTYKVKNMKALAENNTLEAGESVIITLKIDGIYHSDTKYRVYGYSEGLPENSQVVDMISYSADTKETTLITYDIDENDLQGPITTQGLDVN